MKAPLPEDAIIWLEPAAEPAPPPDLRPFPLAPLRARPSRPRTDQTPVVLVPVVRPCSRDGLLRPGHRRIAHGG
ncbi:MAG TPA: hypothetical protein VG389_21190 [Myxococcota bacterium]|nr:hypothetical protein [Myxococcota bacterium]